MMARKAMPVNLRIGARRPHEAGSVMSSRYHPTLFAECARAIPTVVTLDDDQGAAVSAGGGLQEFTPQQRRAQQLQTLEIDLDVREVLAHVFVDLAQPLADVESVGSVRPGASRRANEMVDHEEGGEPGGCVPLVGARDKALNSPGSGTSVTCFCRNAQTSPHCGKATSWDTGESRDHVGTDLEAKEAFGERKGANLAVDGILTQVDRMENRTMARGEQLEFAVQALALRYPDPATQGMMPVQLLTSRRPQDLGDDLWSVLNKVQENLIGGGLRRRSAAGRLMRTRRTTSIREDVLLNGRLWDLATEVLTA